MGFGDSPINMTYSSYEQSTIPNYFDYPTESGFGVDTGRLPPMTPDTGTSGTDWTGVFKSVTSLIGTAGKAYGMYSAAQNQYTSARGQANLMRSEANLMDYNADIARWEGIIAEKERDIEIDQHRDEVGKILGKNATYYAWGNIDMGDPRGTPAQVLLRNLYAAEYDEGIIIERGSLKKQQAESKANLYEYKASIIRSSANFVEAGGDLSRTAGLLSLSGELLKDTGVLS